VIQGAQVVRGQRIDNAVAALAVEVVQIVGVNHGREILSAAVVEQGGYVLLRFEIEMAKGAVKAPVIRVKVEVHGELCHAEVLIEEQSAMLVGDVVVADVHHGKHSFRCWGRGLRPCPWSG